MSKQVIGLNTLFLIPNQVGGTEYYTRLKIDQLLKEDTKNNYVLFCNRENADTFSVEDNNWRKVVLPINAQNRIVRILFEQFVFPFFVLKYKCTELDSFGYFGPILKLGWKHTVTVHDANWRDHPEDNSILERLTLKLLVEGNIHTADAILTDSDFSRKRLSSHFPEHSKKITVELPIIDARFKLAKKKKEKFLLCVSAFYPHKQIPYLLDLWENLTSQLPDYKLILIGKNGNDEETVLARIKNLSRVEYYPKVSFDKLLDLYQTTALFIHPSQYEGFGYPVYEAVASGAKVIVGKKEMYDKSLNAKIEALSFNQSKDINKIVKLFKLS